MNETEPRRRERFLIIVLLLFGIGILLCVGQLAIGIAPIWEVAANMRSNLDPNSDFLTRKNSGIIEPLNPDILTLPAWLNILLTPNAILPTNAGITPPATRVATRVPTQVPTRPATLPPTPVSTFPVTPSTKRPPLRTSTPTNIPSAPSANLAITKTDGSATYTPGSGINYQIVVTNGGPNNASGFRVTDAVPAVINITSVSCAPSGTASCGTNGSGGQNVSFTRMSVNAGAGNRITIIVNGIVNAGATGNLVNTASIVIPGGAGFNDPNTSNNTATDTDTPIFEVDLQINKNDFTSTYTAGGTLTYTIDVTNNSTVAVNGATVIDSFPAQISSATWTCAGACTVASGSGNINDTVNLPAGSSVTYTVTAVVSGTASGALVNTATVNVPAGYTDIDGGNNTFTDTDSPAVDLQITKDDGVATYTPGGTLTYTIVVTNPSTFTVNSAVVTDTFPSQISSASWTCVGTGGATCTASGSGNINDTVNLPTNLPAGSNVTYTVTANVSAYAVGTLANTASVAAPAGFTDTTPGNNSAADTPADTCTANEPDVGPRDDDSINPGPGGSIVILFSPAIIADGNTTTPDFVYYEIYSPLTTTTIDLDWVKIDISSDGSTWYQVFYWGDPPGTNSDDNTNVSLALPPDGVGDVCQVAGVPTEIDNCPIPVVRLHNSTGITIDIDAIPGITTGTNYPWVRISGPPGGSEGPNIDAIQPYYP